MSIDTTFMSQKWLKNRSKKMGLPAGELISLGEERGGACELLHLVYDERTFSEKRVELANFTIEENRPKVNWLKVTGLSPLDSIRKIGELFDLHGLILEDIVSTDQRPKVDHFNGCLFVVVRLPTYNHSRHELSLEQVSIILKDNWVISFEEQAGMIFNPILDRLRHQKGRIRSRQGDYLLYSLLDAVVDNYYPLLEKIGEQIEEAEGRAAAEPSPRTLQLINHLKKDMIFLRKSILPLQELISNLIQEESALMGESIDKYLRDLYDHSKQISDTINIYGEIISHILEIHMTSINNRLNEVMKVLTIISTIFIPLTFLVGIYGMNFKHMPELDWRLSYPVVWVVMILTALSSVFYFKKKKWF